MGSGQNDMSLPDHFRYGLKAPVPKVRSYVTGFSAQNQQYATAALGTTIRIDLPQINNTFLDPNFSFLRFDLTSTVAAELDSSAASWINRVEVYGAGQSQLLESISSYNVLHQALLDVTASPTDTEYAWSVFGGTQEANPRRGLALGAGTTYTFSIPLISILGLSIADGGLYDLDLLRKPGDCPDFGVGDDVHRVQCELRRDPPRAASRDQPGPHGLDGGGGTHNPSDELAEL